MVVLVAVAMVVAVAVAVWRRRLKPPRRPVAAIVPRRPVAAMVPRSAAAAAAADAADAASLPGNVFLRINSNREIEPRCGTDRTRQDDTTSRAIRENCTVSKITSF